MLLRVVAILLAASSAVVADPVREPDGATSCIAAIGARSHLGCEFWAVDLDNAHDVVTTPEQLPVACPAAQLETLAGPICLDPDSTVPDPDTGGFRTTAGLCDPAMGGPSCPSAYSCQSTTYCGRNAARAAFAIAVSNPQAFAVDVTLTGANATSIGVQVPAHASTTLRPQSLGFPDQSVDHTVHAKLSYRITASAPIAAWQFNPLDASPQFPSDSSLLLPTEALGSDYYALAAAGIARRPTTSDYDAFIAIVARVDGTTIVVTPTAATRPGFGAIAVPGLAAGTPATFQLDAFDVLALHAVAGADLSGTHVVASDPTRVVAVFAGTESSYIPNAQAPAGFPNGPCCDDHLEESMLPTRAWGRQYVVVRSLQRLATVATPDVVRILARDAGTVVTIAPAPITGSCGAALGPGQSCTVEVVSDTSIVATHAVQVARLMKSATWFDAFGQQQGSGDPALAIVAPVEQFRTAYEFFVPAERAQRFAAVAVATGSTVTLDGIDITSQVTGTVGGFRAGRVALAVGHHVVACGGAGCGVELLGIDSNTAFLAAAGMNLSNPVVGVFIDGFE